LIPASQIYRFAGKYFLNGAGAHSCLFAHIIEKSLNAFPFELDKNRKGIGQKDG
jgi:hypothetical protein